MKSRLNKYLVLTVILSFLISGSVFPAFYQDDRDSLYSYALEEGAEKAPTEAAEGTDAGGAEKAPTEAAEGTDAGGAVEAAAEIAGDVLVPVTPSEVAEAVTEAANETAPVFTFLESGDRRFSRRILVPFLDTKTVAYKWRFPYSNEFFRHSSDEFSIGCARGSLGLALSAFRSIAGTLEPQYETYLEGAGFKNLYSFGFDKETTADSLSGIIGMKNIEDFTVIAAVTCGQGYQNEWAGNLIVGKGVRHEGFDKAAKLLESYLQEYIDKYEITGKKKLWLTGMSRAGAIGNITAADMIESGEYEDVYAYLFGVPRTTREPVRYKGIYNICGQYDPVAETPLQSWGFERYGTDLYTPAQETESSFSEYSEKASVVCRKLTGKDFRNNPEINYQLHLIIEFLGQFFPTCNDYADRLQDSIIDCWAAAGDEGFMEALRAAMSRVKPKNEIEKIHQSVFIEYMSYIAGEHLRANQRQVNAGSWDPDEPLAANMVLEHRPSTYVNWLFADIPPEELFGCSITTRKVVLNGKVSLGVYSGEEWIGSIDAAGKVTTPDGSDGSAVRPSNNASAAAEGAEGSVLPDIFMMRNGSQTSINLPCDSDYVLRVESGKLTNLTYYDLSASVDKSDDEPGMIYAGTLSDGFADMKVAPYERLPELSNRTGSYVCFGKNDFDFSPTVLMSEELGATKLSFLTIKTLIGIIASVLTALLLLAVICLLIWIFHFTKRIGGHPPYSDLYVIVPHMLCITVFMGLTQFLTFFMFSIGRARVECAAVTIAFIFLLALRGLIRRRRLRNLITTILLFALVPLTHYYYSLTPFYQFSYSNMVKYFALIMALAGIAASTFKKPKTPPSDEDGAVDDPASGVMDAIGPSDVMNAVSSSDMSGASQ